jgi:lipopolysaccharide transport system ATP-binding protein
LLFGFKDKGKVLTYIRLKNVSVDIPIYSSSSRLLKSRVLNVLSGGRIASKSEGRLEFGALNSISIDIKSGDRIGVIGENGAGKSTLLRVLSGVYAPTAGCVEISGSIASLIDLSLGIDPDLSGVENIYLRGLLLGLSKAKIDQLVNSIIDFTEIGDFIEMPLRTYSTGMQMRLAFAVSTALRPDILLMDEWLSVGDGNFQKKAIHRMNEMIANTKILILASHSIDLIKAACTKVIWLKEGRLEMFDDINIVLERHCTIK